ncbi:MAG: hypothetical protein KBC17_03455 [Candidatus Pacebacteria bacterium]|nr:hypothetical protein [Candidatus Paceibacterota bacterium]
MTRNLIKASALGTALFSFAFVATAATWTPPTATPPANNVAAPINISTSTQTKEGGLVVGNTSGGFVNYGASALVGRVDIGPFDCYYINGPTSYLCGSSTTGGTGTTGGGSGGAAGASLIKNIALNNPTSLIGNLISSFTPSIAHAVGTPSTDKLHVYGDVSINGAMRVGGYSSSYDVCIKNGTNCPTVTAASLFPIGTNPTVTTTQGAYIGWNAITGGTGETDFINSKGGGSGGFAFQNVASSSGATRTTLMRITGGGAVGIGTGTADPAADLEVSGTSNRNGPLVKIGSVGTANGDNAAGTERGLTIAASSVAGQGQLFNVKRGTTSLFSVGGNGNVGVGTATPSARFDVRDEAHFSTGGYVDPQPGVLNALKSTSIATGKLYVVNQFPVYRQNNITGMTCNAVSNQNATTANTGNPQTGVLYFGSYAFPPLAMTDFKYCYMSGGFRENVLLGYLIPASTSAYSGFTGTGTGAGPTITTSTPTVVGVGAGARYTNIYIYGYATGGGPFTDVGGEVWNNAQTTMLSHNSTTLGPGTQIIATSMPVTCSTSGATHYKVRAYGVNTSGTGYGSWQTATVPMCP